MKYLSLIFTALISFACNSQASDKSAVAGESSAPVNLESPDIQVEVAGLSAGTAYLVGHVADQRYRADSAAVNASGQMRFQREEPYQPGFYFIFLPGNTSLQVLIDADQTFSMKTKTGDLVGAMQVEGNLDNELLYRNLKFEQQIQPQFQAVAEQLKAAPAGSPQHQQHKTRQDELVAQRKAHLQEFYDKYPDAFFTKFKYAGQNPDVKTILKPDGSPDVPAQLHRYRTEFWDNVDFSDERLLNTPVVFNKLKRYITELTPQRADSINSATDFLMAKVLNQPEYFKFFANWITINYDPNNTTLMDPQAIFVHMVRNYFTRERAFWSDSTEIFALQQRAYEMAASLVGLKGPDVVAPDPNGKMRSIYELKAPYIIVYMYNPTCEHCMVQTPQLVQFYREWNSKGVDVFAIALDTNDKEWKDYIAKVGMPWANNVFDPTNKSIFAKYFVDITPEVYVLNPERTIIAKNLNVNQIAEVIQRDRQGR
jgi:thiol-disulfide isomerase/thioredoxin